MSDLFSGSVFRTARERSDGAPLIQEAFYLSLGEDRGPAERLLRHLYKAAKRWWIVDVADFRGVSKLAPAVLYTREIPTTVDADTFIARYFSAPHTFKLATGRVSTKPTFGRARRGSAEHRQQNLELHRRVLGLDADEPWCDVTTSYEHYWARVLFATREGYREEVWFLSSGIDGDPSRELSKAIKERERDGLGRLIAQIGPHEANTMEFPMTGLALGHAYRFFTGVDEFESCIVTLSEWR